MTSKKVLLSSLSLTAFCVVGNVANAYEFNDKLYAKLYANIGYEASIPNNVTGSKGDGLFHAPTVSVGGNLFYNLNDTFNPFVGLEAKGKFNLTSKLDNYDVYRFNEFFNLNAKIGSKIKVNKNVSVSPYVLAGMTVAQIRVNKKAAVVNTVASSSVNSGVRRSIAEITGGREGGAVGYAVLEGTAGEPNLNIDDLTPEALDIAISGNFGAAMNYFFAGNHDSLDNCGINGVAWDTTANSKEQAIQQLRDLFTPQASMNNAPFDPKWVIKVIDIPDRYIYLDLNHMSWKAGANKTLFGGDYTENIVLGYIDKAGSSSTAPITIDNDSNNKTKVGFNVGAGVDVLIKERFTIGAEYRYSEVSFGSGFKVKTNNIGARFGIQFL